MGNPPGRFAKKFAPEVLSMKKGKGGWSMGPIRRFSDVCSDPVEYARQWKRSTGGKVVAHT
ncbi:MAG: hypothetical protein DRH32_04445 [Deltaproteobacteria bacterium]|nr:MAG: hypothetical protein DRH32_04445 [Deltaproteobacteria bacterium]